MANTTENPNEQTIKCVLVGDNNVGKTKLICARAYRQKHPDARCFKNSSHVPTVWAIDQYRINKDVLENARCNIDGTTVSLRLWDTFGDHHKNRKFAYGKADVVVVCFSICDARSLRHVKQFWIPEVRKHCKNIPIILTGCKADLRFADLVKLNKTKSCLSRAIRHCDILYPDRTQSVANELNCPYYEASVLLCYGVQELFQNVCRAALIHRKNLSFWNSRLKKISRPALQKPLEPPMPEPPKKAPENSFFNILPKLDEIYKLGLLTDVVFSDKDQSIAAHKVILAASFPVFWRLFALEIDEAAHSSLTSFSFLGNDPGGCPIYLLDFPPDVFRLIVDFCYTGRISIADNRAQTSSVVLSHLVKISRILDLTRLEKIAIALENGNGDRVDELSVEFVRERSRNLHSLCVKQRLFSDVIFVTDDGPVFGHKVLLSSGCDVMYAMFAGRFIESANDKVSMPFTSVKGLQMIFEFLYSGDIEDFDENEEDYCELIALANRLCLQNLVSYLENRAIEHLQHRDEDYKQTDDVLKIQSLCEDAIELLHISQFHNAPVLSRWCLHFLCVRYNEACRHTGKYIKSLPDDVQHYIEEHRWPPVWFIKQLDHYERALVQRNESENRKVKKY